MIWIAAGITIIAPLFLIWAASVLFVFIVPVTFKVLIVGWVLMMLYGLFKE
jgi:hypothetical protein